MLTKNSVLNRQKRLSNFFRLSLLLLSPSSGIYALMTSSSIQLSSVGRVTRTTRRTVPKRTWGVVFGMTSSPDEDTEDDYKPQYGESFIGGDPCGSKYNTDPHDAKVEKPGMPDSMKARIQFLVDQKKKEEEKEKAAQKQEEA